MLLALSGLRCGEIVSSSFIVMLVEEKVGREIRGKFLQLDLEALPSDSNELGVIEDVVSGSGPMGLATRGAMGWPLELGRSSSEGGTATGSRRAMDVEATAEKKPA